MILEPGSKVLVVHRRLFETDHSRFFIGQVDAYETGMMRVTGRTYGRTVGGTGTFVGKQHAATKVISVASGTVLVYQLPIATEMDSLSLAVNRDGDLLLADRHGVKLDLSVSLHVAPAKAGHRP
jgi:hypothetical protein